MTQPAQRFWHVKHGLRQLQHKLRRFKLFLRRLLRQLSCREATVLLIAREDRALRRSERLALSLHLPLCQACQRMQGQVIWMRHALRQWRQDNPPPH